ncbi:MAG: DsbA family protein [Micrococcales bacterium]
MSKTIKVDVWSDVACPWCYIGKRKLENAIQEFEAKGGSVEVEYHSYLLNPEMPVDYEGSQKDYLAAHKGLPLVQVESMSDRVKRIASDVGLRYDFENQIMTNTILANQLIHFAKSKGKQAEMKERLMAAHFVEARHVGKIDVLSDLAAEIGLDRQEAKDALESEKYLGDFQGDIAQAREYGITGVPFFVLQGRYGISGAQESATFLNAFEQISAS